MSEYRLFDELISRSVSNKWDDAKLEWGLDHVWRESEPETCLCGHYPIIEICQLKNKKNGTTALVGNCCVKKFTSLPSDLIFQAISRISGDITRAANAETIAHARQKNLINAWEHDFYIDTWKKRKLSPSQQKTRQRINQKILANIVRSGK